jgi:hypothetical protein
MTAQLFWQLAAFSLWSLLALSVCAGSSANPPSVPTGASFQELKTLVEAQQKSADRSRVSARLVQNWLQSQDMNRLDVEQLQWCLNHILPSNDEKRSFSAVWTGFLTPPRTGNYVFSTSPINTNSPFGTATVRHSIAATVSGKKVIDAGPATRDASRPSPAEPRQAAAKSNREIWKWKGDPIELQANQPVPIRVAVEYESSEPSVGNSPSAILLWEGPGMDRRPVASNFLRPPAGHGNGLRAEYRFGENQREPLIQPSPTIEYAWRTPSDVAPQNLELVLIVTQRLWQLCTDQDYIAECTAGRVNHPYFQDDSGIVYLSVAQRRQFLQLLQKSQELLGRATDQQIVHVYRNCRFGAEDEALHVLGEWMQIHTDITPHITLDFTATNRQSYFELAHYVARQLSDHYRLLQQNYLETADGKCCLPTAYTLSYCYFLNGRLSEWVEYLDEILDSPEVAGDRRVNWLVARAQVEEIRDSAVRPQLMAGSGWLDEASLVADTRTVKLRLVKERITRLAAQQDWREAEMELAAATDSPRSWRDQLTQVRREAKSAALEDATNVRRSYLSVLKKRLQKAANRGDSVAEARYAERLRLLEDSLRDH